jgi:glycosyltransferase involved in cell wall biosynthesis
MTILAWPKTGLNPYNEIIYKELENQGIEVLSHREHRSAGILSKVDVFHFHWINAYLNHKPLKAFIATFIFMMYVFILKLKGTKIIWTLHNSVEFTHHGKNRWLENILVPFLLNNADKIIVHSKFQKSHLDKKYYDKIVWIPHQNYCSILTKNIKEKNNSFLFFGTVNPYKGVETAINAYNSIKTLTSFKIIGKISDEKYKILLNNLSCDNKNISIEDRYIDDEELENLVKESKAIILPFSQITNSGSLIYALSCRTNVIMKRSILTDELYKEYKDLEKVLFTFETEEELSNIIKNNLVYNTSDFDDFINKTDMNNLVEKYIEVMR